MSDLRPSLRLAASFLAAAAVGLGLLAFGGPEAVESPVTPPAGEPGDVDTAVFAVG